MDKKIFLVLLALSFAPPSWAYDNVMTHPDLTRAAVDKSVATPIGGLMRDLGLASWVANPRYPLSLGRAAPRYLMAEGVRLEDLDDRPVNHFYDPAHQRPLTVYGRILGQMSFIWALDFDNDIPGQDFSLGDARRFMYQALTTRGPKEVRDQHWANTFLALGHVLHHIQDMAQPQHVRNDDHLEGVWWLYPFWKPSRYEHYTRDSRLRVQELAFDEQVQAAFPGAPELKLPRHFWVNDAQTGMAEFTNRNFVSHGTNFEMRGDQVVTPLYPQPVPGTPTDYTLEELYGTPEAVPPQMASLCSWQGSACVMTMYPSIGPTLSVAKASTLSIYDQDLHSRGLEVIYDRLDEDIQYVVTRLFALNRFNFDEAHRVLIPRAVSYTAGFINYFFRGRLEITPPALGAYAVADHSEGQGFATIKAKVKNVTPGEAMRGGTVVAVVKFRLNECYRPDLSGEFELDHGRLIPPDCDEDAGESYLTNEEFIITSAEQALVLGSGDEQELTFVLTEPVPFNATDVYLQVVYQGVLGDEARAIAMGTADISEPTYFSVFNGTDVFVIPDSFNRGTPFYWTTIRDNIARPPYSVVDLNEDGLYRSPPDVYIDGRSLNFEVFLDGGKIADLPALPEGRFSRIALLVGSAFNVRVRFGGYYDYHYPGLPPKLGRINWERRTYEVSGLWRDRNWMLQWLAPLYYYYYLTPVYDPEYFLLLESRVADATQPVPAGMTEGLTGPVSLASGSGGVYDRPPREPVERIAPMAAPAGEPGGPRAFSPAEALPQ